MAITATKWGRIADMTATDALAAGDTYGVPGGLVANGGVTGTMGYYCIFNMDGDTGADETHDFDFPVMGDLTVVINSGGSDLDTGTTIDVSMRGSVDGVNYVDLHTDFIDGVSIDNVPAAAVYDYDAKGRMPYMRLELTPASNEEEESIMIHVVPH